MKSPSSSGPMVLMTTDAVGGVLAYSCTLARALAARGCHVYLVVTGPRPSPDQLQTLAGLDGIAVEVTDWALEWLDPAGAELPATASRAAALAERVGPDVVHLNSYREAAFEWPAPVVVVAHSCVSSWWRACRGADPDEPRWQIYQAGVAAGLAAADAWVAPTAAHAKAVRTLHRPPRPGRVIWNGVRPVGAASGKQNFVLAAGRLWDEAKNIAVLAKIAADVDWPIKIAGPMTPPDASGHPGSTGSHVEMLGEMPQAALHGQMRRAAIYAAPALYEPFGLAIAEAASAGCALLLSDIPSLRELWDGAALFVDPRDAHAVADACRRLCRDAALRGELQQAAAGRARRYGVAAMADTYLDLYRSLTRHGGASRSSSIAAALPA